MVKMITGLLYFLPNYSGNHNCQFVPVKTTGFFTSKFYSNSVNALS